MPVAPSYDNDDVIYGKSFLCLMITATTCMSVCRDRVDAICRQIIGMDLFLEGSSGLLCVDICQ